MGKTQKPVWKIKDSDGKYLDCKGWTVDHDSTASQCYLPLHKDGKVVALIVANGHYDAIAEEVKTTADEIVAALNAAAAPVAVPTERKPVAWMLVERHDPRLKVAVTLVEWEPEQLDERLLQKPLYE